MAVIRNFKYSDREARYSVSSMTRLLRVLMFPKSSSVISVPIEVSAADFTSLAISSGTPTSEKSVSFALVFKPISRTTLAYAKFSVTIFPISGKCQPYHSRSLMAKLLSSLSRSSKRPTAWMIIVSTLSGENFNLKRDRVCAKPKDIVLTSCSSSPSIKSVRCMRTPRMISFKLSLITDTSMPSFLLIFIPRGLSNTARLSVRPASTTFFFRNFFRLFPTLPSVNSVQASMAALVSSNL
mmetsp:Transcript_31782/g.68395  ORF Transcript_31782/g.68395 Transcript_31782/m.68395 type:complete len:239 (-) Transcript_31782:204-920(-)